MIPKECKRLAEVDFPIVVVSAHAAREKSIRHGHPSTLHLWWAQRPLASCRAMLLALLLPDPCDEHCPSEFKEKARSLIKGFTGIPGSDAELRTALLRFIGDVASWDVANNPRWIGAARDLVKAAHPDEPPLVVDSFAGGGSIPLEALRLGCDAFASDLNPVACLICKVLLEDITRHGPELAEELRKVGVEVKAAAEKELADFYPIDPDGSGPIAYLWARTVRCEAPNCGAEIPLLRSLWLSKKANRRRALKPVIVRRKGEAPRVEFEVFEPKTEEEVRGATVTLAKATCPCCNTVLGPDRVRAQLSVQRGGANVIFDSKGRRSGRAMLLAVVTSKPGEQGRLYRVATERDYSAVHRVQTYISEQASVKAQTVPPLIPDEPTPQDGTGSVGGGFRTRKYGIHTFGDFFTQRQKTALALLTKEIRDLPSSVSLGTRSALALVVSRSTDYNSANCSWAPHGEYIGHTFTRQAMPIIWDFVETNPFAEASGGVPGAIEWVARVADLAVRTRQAQVQIADAARSPLPDDAASAWFTDPPYYDAVPYADLSDYFFVWLKRCLPSFSLLTDPSDSSNPLTPKIQEAVRDEQSRLFRF
jgi:putative DNA methylase